MREGPGWRAGTKEAIEQSGGEVSRGVGVRRTGSGSGVAGCAGVVVLVWGARASRYDEGCGRGEARGKVLDEGREGRGAIQGHGWVQVEVWKPVYGIERKGGTDGGRGL